MQVSRVSGLVTVGSLDGQAALRGAERAVLSLQQAGAFPVVVASERRDPDLRHGLARRGVVFLDPADRGPGDQAAPAEARAGGCSEAGTHVHAGTCADAGARDDGPGLAAPVARGLAFLAGASGQVAYAPASSPVFSPATLDLLLDVDAEVATPSCQGQGGHPVVMTADAARELAGYRGPDGLRGALRALGARRRWVDVDDLGVLARVCDEDDLEAWLPAHESVMLRPVARVSVEDDGPVLDDRAKLLLFLLGRTGTMREAVSMMALSYAKGWDIVNRLEGALGAPVVERRRGGSSGGSARLTPRGEGLLVAYQAFQDRVGRFAWQEFSETFAHLAP